MRRNGPATERVKTLRIFRGKHVHGRVVCGEGYDFLRRLKSGSAAVVFLDPPFNLGKCYDRNRADLDRQPDSAYEGWLEGIIEESSRVLAPGGTLYLYHIPRWAIRFAPVLERRLSFQHWIAIAMKNGFVRGRRLYPAHYALLMFSKGRPAVLNRPKLEPVTCRHCGLYVKDYGGYRSIIEAKGINLSDVWDDVSPVRHRTHKTRTANELPRVIFDRAIAMSGVADALYVDPFAGSGAGVASAVRARMRFACCDLVSENCRIIERRLDELRKQMRNKGREHVRDAS